MRLRINHNIPALNAYRNLSQNVFQTSKNMEKLTSGLRINRAADDAAGLAISEKMRSQIRGLSQAERNILDGVSLTQVADGGLDGIHKLLQRARELAVQAGNDTLTNSDRQALQKELEQLKQGINDIAYGADSNGIKPLIPSYTNSEGTSIRGNVDIIFIIDTSGSMGGTIDNVKSNLDTFVNNLGNVDGQFGLVQYSDIGSGEPINKWDFSNDINTFKNNLQELRDRYMFGGGDFPESGLEGIMDSTKGALSFPFRDNSVKQFVLITDATVHESSDGAPYTYTINDVANELKNKEIIVSVVSNNFAHTQLSQLTDTTDGSYLDINSEFSDSLKSLAEDISSSVPPQDPEIAPIRIQTGANLNDIFEIFLTDARTTALGVDDIDLLTRDGAESAISKLDEAIQKVSTERSKFGAYQNALEHVRSNVSNTHENLTSAESRIRDTDMALEMAEYTKNNILNQSAQAMLAQSKQFPQGILKLLQG